MAFLYLFFLLAGFDTLLRDGGLALENKRYSAARASFESARDLRPDSPEVWLGLVQTYSRLGEKTLTAEATNKMEALASRQPTVLQNLALFHSKNGDTLQAAEWEEKYAVYEIEGILPAVLLFLKAGQPARATALAESSLSRTDTAELHHALGQSLEAGGNTPKALAELRKALEMNPYEERYYFDLAQLLMLHQNFDSAARTLESSRRIFAKSAQLELSLGVAYYGLRRFPESIDSFLRVIAIAPEVEQPYTFLGRIIDHAGDRLSEIEQRFAAFAKATPNNAVSQFLYAKAINAKSGDPTVAESLLRKSIALDEKNWESHLELGIALEKRAAYPEAARELEKSIELNPKASPPHYRLARVYDRMGKKPEAAAERVRHAALLAEEEAVGNKASGMDSTTTKANRE